MLQDNKYARKYSELKEQADLAYNMYVLTNHDLDWDYYMHCEDSVSQYALDFEDKIWEEDTDDGRVVL